MKWRVRESDLPTPRRKWGEVPCERQSPRFAHAPVQLPRPHVLLPLPSPSPLPSQFSVPVTLEFAPQRQPLAPPTGQQGDRLSEKEARMPRC